MEMSSGLMWNKPRGNSMRIIIHSVLLLSLFGHERLHASEVVVTRIKSDLRSISLDWTPVDSGNSRGSSRPSVKSALTSGSGGDGGDAVSSSSSYLVKYCEDSPWDDAPRACSSFQTNDTHAQLNDLRPSTKYLVNVERESVPTRAGRMLTAPDTTVANNNDPHQPAKDSMSFIDKSKALPIETQKYAVRNVDCKKGQTDVTIETGEDFEGVISVQKADGRPDSRCLIRGSGTSQRTYILPINHSICAMEFLENGTVMNTVILIQEHASLVLGSDRSLRISCNYQPAVIRLETGMGHGSHIIQVGSGNDDEGPAKSTSPQRRPVVFTAKTYTETLGGPALPPAPSALQQHQSQPNPIRGPVLHEPIPSPTDRSGNVVNRRPLTTRNGSGLTITSTVSTTPEKWKNNENFYGDMNQDDQSSASASLRTPPDDGERVSANFRPMDGHDFVIGAGERSTKTGENTQNVGVKRFSYVMGMNETLISATATIAPNLAAGLRDDRQEAVLLASTSNFSHPEIPLLSENLKPLPAGISLLQVVAITATCSLAAILLVCLVIWLVVFRDVCSRHRTQRRPKLTTEQLRFA